MALAAAAERVAAEFEYTKEDVNRGVQEFIREIDEGLEKQGTTLSQIPTYVTSVPNGTEKGLYMAVDLGGTNFRVCSVQLHGNSTFSLTQSKVKIPQELMVAKTSHELFAFLAKQIETFLKTHHNEHYAAHIEKRKSFTGIVREEEIFSLGFTFSFPVNQTGINKGTLLRWTKGFDIDDTLGKDVCALLQKEIDALYLPVRVAALVNDTVGTLMARSYTSPGKTGTLLGAIFGTGTNGAYVEKLDRLKKLKNTGKDTGEVDQSTGEMIVNTEWGSFDNALKVLPVTSYDRDLDRESNNPGIQEFEKRVSGMFLGEILRRAILSLVKDPAVPLFADEHSSQNELHSTTNIAEDSSLYKHYGLDTSFLSITAGDNSAGLKVTRQSLEKEYGISAASAEDAEAVRLIAAAIGKRAARLSAVPIAAIIISTGRLKEQKDISNVNSGSSDNNEDDIIDVGVDGSLVEFYPNFEEHMREALREIPEIGPQGEKRIRIGIAKDGSGVGAALIALVADRTLKVGSPITASNGGFFSNLINHINRAVRLMV
ncbi:hypothetical protein M433DRAFT_140924 [Acidomyces richmondensis BFW]|nr:MAG: hypothetical protein FE78DRAFT_73507 [Acidomyces sp. 'richmondensis']KYG48533.1 hypothetical protein M433DRAFT_140924 [Acidomyces richmondensis BFW]